MPSKSEVIEAVREHWPFIIGATILVGGHIYLYVIQGVEWEAISPPLLIAIVVVVAIEMARSALGRNDEDDEPSITTESNDE